MATPGLAALAAPARTGMPRFVWESWRGITRSDLALWLLLAFALGIAQGGAAAILTRQIVWWRQFISSFVDAFIPILLLFLCVAVARNVRPRRMPKWVPFAGAALGALLLHRLVAWLVIEPIVCGCDAPGLWPGGTGMDWVTGMWLNFPPMALMCFLVSFGYMYALEARRRADALRAVQLDGARIGRQSYETRLQAMQARVEPQFLFDTLGQVEQLYEADASLAERVLDDLIVYLRGVLPSLANSNSTVAIELEIARAWLDIVQARSGGRLSVSVEKRADAGAARMPPMVLLPLVEHAVRQPSRLPASVQSVGIEASRDGDRLRIVITDSFGAFASAVQTDPVAEVRERLQALYGSAATLSFDDTRAIVDIPYECDG